MTKIDAEFWHGKWKTGKIGFHQATYHPSLVKHWPALGVTNSATVFVPLCGKTKDMLYLHERGHKVFGVELSETAIKDFASENMLELTKTTDCKFSLYTSKNYDLRAGDFFDLGKDAFRNVGAVYDRAALIALPTDLRLKYASYLKTLLSKDIEILLITLSYDQSKISGPPFSIQDADVQTLFGDWCEIEKLEQIAPEGFRGIKAVEAVFRLIVK